MEINLSWLNAIATTKDYYIYALFALIGLYSNLYFVIKNEKRGPKLGDIGAFFGQLPFVLAAALIFDTSPIISLIVGFIPDRLGSLFRNKGLSMVIGRVMSLLTSEEKEKGKETPHE